MYSTLTTELYRFYSVTKRSRIVDSGDPQRCVPTSLRKVMFFKNKQDQIPKGAREREREAHPHDQRKWCSQKRDRGWRRDILPTTGIDEDEPLPDLVWRTPSRKTHTLRWRTAGGPKRTSRPVEESATTDRMIARVDRKKGMWVIGEPACLAARCSLQGPYTSGADVGQVQRQRERSDTEVTNTSPRGGLRSHCQAAMASRGHDK